MHEAQLQATKYIVSYFTNALQITFTGRVEYLLFLLYYKYFLYLAAVTPRLNKFVIFPNLYLIYFRLRKLSFIVLLILAES